MAKAKVAKAAQAAVKKETKPKVLVMLLCVAAQAERRCRGGAHTLSPPLAQAPPKKAVPQDSDDADDDDEADEPMQAPAPKKVRGGAPQIYCLRPSVPTVASLCLS